MVMLFHGLALLVLVMQFSIYQACAILSALCFVLAGLEYQRHARKET